MHWIDFLIVGVLMVGLLAMGFALLSPDRINLHAVYAAPFVNDRSSSPAEGMSKSHDETPAPTAAAR